MLPTPTTASVPPLARNLIGLTLMAVMLATRFHHFGDALHLPDASWAVFFLAGLYLPSIWLPGLLLLAVAIDLTAIGWMGVSGYCLTPAYAGLQLAHLSLWAGGRWLARAHPAPAPLPPLAGAVLVSTLLAFALSNGAFYWLGARVAEPTWAQFARTWVDYAPRFFMAMALYVGVAALAHALLHTLALRRRPVARA
ncbi:MAG TPA: hypothetical protein PKH69_09355 [Thiobacillaceae bacterium]|nr:hypothetical protein [Thiobacillaceae bacterium]HNU64360.1 hypothetical protein [Thiobacillaceae bacterium]